MAKRKTAAQWRELLEALGRTGNVRLAARAAGMNVGTAYDRCIKDDAFAARMDAARAKGKVRAAAGKARLKKAAGQELVLRRTRHGDKLVRASPDRWSAKAEATFLAELRRTGCVRWAAAACGLSTNALYYRRKTYSDFAERWAAAEAEARVRIPALLTAATIASLDPEVAGEDLPRVNVDQAIAIARLKCGDGAAGRKGRSAPAEPPIEEVRASIMRKLDAIEAHEKRQAAKRGD
jgi:molybdenum-dependent DNA-binding transcriptional regulator ModE